MPFKFTTLLAASALVLASTSAKIPLVTHPNTPTDNCIRPAGSYIGRIGGTNIEVVPWDSNGWNSNVEMPQVCGERCRPCKGGRICPMVCYRELYCKEDTICQALASFEAQCPLPSGAYLAGINGNNYVVVPFDSNLWGNISTLPPGLKYRCHPCQSSVACPRICIYEVYGTPDDICKALGSKPAISNSSGSSSSLQYI